ncbi:hypothetical protein CoNPh17_CDS0151 [Staphylococcus phage S-CoN_Ph17]|nr:hypothetical protein CoNPh17_CDS0151 [Staphylococcus phage S-CoN_Ph17]
MINYLMSDYLKFDLRKIPFEMVLLLNTNQDN